MNFCYTKEYKPVPNGTELLKVDLWCCGDDCNCRQFRIWAHIGPNHPHAPEFRKKEERGWGWILWEGIFTSDPDTLEQEEMIEDLQLACNFYGIVLSNIEEGCIYYIEGERKL